MDIIALTFYGIVCGVLGYASPSLGNPIIRLIVGIVVGLIAATLLPSIRSMIG